MKNKIFLSHPYDELSVLYSSVIKFCHNLISIVIIMHFMKDDINPSFMSVWRMMMWEN